ncbi:MAG TPA: hypothetical protein VMF08_06570, partial [Candidatus Sulfotelmatobacter sp.]|nr:hypothetical protein [Candidatus Sulfotelmatobacter sp.]
DVCHVGTEAAAGARNNATFHDNDNVAFVAFRVAEMLPTKQLAINDVADVADFQSNHQPSPLHLAIVATKCPSISPLRPSRPLRENYSFPKIMGAVVNPAHPV